MKKILILIIMIIALLGLSSATNVTYDFEGCTTLNGCGLNETGYNAGLNQSYINTSFDGDGALYYNGQRAGSALRYVLEFLNVPNNTTTMSYQVYPLDASYAEMQVYLLANDSAPSSSNYARVGASNSDYSASDRVNLVYDFNGEEANTSCSKYTVGTWNNITLQFDYDAQTFTYYKDGILDCILDWSDHSADVGNLGNEVYFLTSSSDTPNMYFDNIVLANETTVINETPEEPIVPINDTTYLYDFENACAVDDLDCNGLREIGFINIINQSYITDYNGSRVLYYNGIRQSSSPYASYELQFMYVPQNVSILEYDVFPLDSNSAEARMTFRANTTPLHGATSDVKIDIYNTDFYDRVQLTYDYDGSEINTTCSQYTVGEWNHIKVVLDYDEETLSYYKKNMTTPDCNLDWSAYAGEVTNLGEAAMLRTTSGDTPNMMFDNIYFEQVIPPNNTAPSITDVLEPSAQSINETDNLTLYITVTDADNDTLAYNWSVDGSPVGTNTDNYEFVGTAYGSGTYSVVVTVTDGIAPPENRSWTITVNNQAPTINSRSPTATDITIYQDGAQTFTLNASDPEGGVLFYSWELDGNPLYLEVYPMWSFIAPDRGTGLFNVTAFVEDEEAQIVQTTWMLNVTAGYTADYSSDDISPVIIDGIVKVFLSIIAFAGLIALLLVYLEGRNRVTGKKRKR